MPSHLVALGAFQGASTGTVFDISSSSETTVASCPRARRLEHHDGVPGSTQFAGRGQTGKPRADHDHVDAAGRAAAVGDRGRRNRGGRPRCNCAGDQTPARDLARSVLLEAVI